jgi:pyrimidine-specific ribonucleoside hydrolase
MATNRLSFFTAVLFILACILTPGLWTSGNAHENAGACDTRSLINLNKFPERPSDFNRKVRPYVSRIIQKHGREEWKAVVLTNELHHHMGLFSIVGAKMGIRAREVLQAPFDTVTVVSYAGFKPPYSCLNDGIQVSTGASLGKGAIRVVDGNEPRADFISGEKKITLKLKQEIINDIEKVIKECSEKYSFQSSRYFSELDKLSVEYWLKWDRAFLFEETVEPGQ